MQNGTYISMPQSPLAELAITVADMKEQASLLKEADRRVVFGGVPVLAIAEVSELEEALNVNQASSVEIGKEAMDVVIFIFSMLIVTGKLEELSYVPGHINGVAMQSGFLDNLATRIGDIVPQRFNASDQIRVRQEIYRYFMSMLNNFPALGVLTPQILEATITKVLGNRNPQFYSAYEAGRMLNPDEIEEKYRFLERFSRMLRAHYQMTLTPQIWEEYADLVAKWRDGDAVLDELKKRLLMQRLLNPRINQTSLYKPEQSFPSSGIVFDNRPRN